MLIDDASASRLAARVSSRRRGGGGGDLSTATAEGLAGVLLVGVLFFAVAMPRGLPEVVAGVPAAAVVVATGAISWQHAWDEVARLGSVIAFLAAVLVLWLSPPRD